MFKKVLNKELLDKLKSNSQEFRMLRALVDKVESLKDAAADRAELAASVAAIESTASYSVAAAENAVSDWIAKVLDGNVAKNIDGVYSLEPEELGVEEKNRHTPERGNVRALRTSQGTFISALNLKKLLNLVLFQYVRDIMDSNDDTLNWVTGRLAHSATVTDIESRSNTTTDKDVSVMFTYMLMPYETFETYGKHPVNKPPSELIDTALSLALEEILNRDSYRRIQLQFDT
jgi:hypothetical protein